MDEPGSNAAGTHGDNSQASIVSHWLACTGKCFTGNLHSFRLIQLFETQAKQIPGSIHDTLFCLRHNIPGIYGRFCLLLRVTGNINVRLL